MAQHHVDYGALPLHAYDPIPQLLTVRHDVARSRLPSVDAHAHLGRWLTAGKWAVPDVGAFLAAMDACNVEVVVNLDGKWAAELEANLERYDRRHPGRFHTYCHVDWSALLSSDAERRLVDDLTRSVAAGAHGLKVWKDLGLSVRDAAGALVLPHDPRLFGLFETAGVLRVPVAIHTGDPVAFFCPVDARNERLEELLAHPEWSYAGLGVAHFHHLLDSLETVITDHPGTTFLAVHVGGYAEDLSWVARMLSDHPNLYVDIAARVAELGRQPRATRDLLVRHRGRILFGSDGIPPSAPLYRIHFRFLETADEHFPYSMGSPPPTGRWAISGVDLPPAVLADIYSGAFRALLHR